MWWAAGGGSGDVGTHLLLLRGQLGLADAGALPGGLQGVREEEGRVPGLQGLLITVQGRGDGRRRGHRAVAAATLAATALRRPPLPVGCVRRQPSSPMSSCPTHLHACPTHLHAQGAAAGLGPGGGQLGAGGLQGQHRVAMWLLQVDVG